MRCGPIRCTKCGCGEPTVQFAKRTNGRPMSWCRACKRALDRVAIAQKRALGSPKATTPEVPDDEMDI